MRKRHSWNHFRVPGTVTDCLSPGETPQRFSFCKTAPAGHSLGLKFNSNKGSQNSWRQRLAGDGGSKPTAYLFQAFKHPVEMGKQSARSWSLSVTTTRPQLEPSGCRLP